MQRCIGLGSAVFVCVCVCVRERERESKTQFTFYLNLHPHDTSLTLNLCNIFLNCSLILTALVKPTTINLSHISTLSAHFCNV